MARLEPWPWLGRGLRFRRSGVGKSCPFHRSPASSRPAFIDVSSRDGSRGTRKLPGGPACHRNSYRYLPISLPYRLPIRGGAAIRSDENRGAPATSHLMKCAVRFPHFLMLVGCYATFCLEAILASQPFRKRAGTDSYLGAPEHRTEEPDLGPEVSFWVAPRL